MGTLGKRDIFYVGLMAFALFLGAGNLIFPPELGYQSGAGGYFFVLLLGFLCTGVGLPLLGVVSAALAGGGLEQITRYLPHWFALSMGILLYLSIGPLFAVPRTALVSYNFTIPLFHSSGNAFLQWMYGLFFFSITLALSLFPGKLVESVGKVITPVLILVLVVITFGVIVQAHSTPSVALGPYVQHLGPNWSASKVFSIGFLRGYLTMDTLSSMAFGIVIINALRDHGVTDKKMMTKSTIRAGLIAALGLSWVYVMLCFLGANARSQGILTAQHPTGAYILTHYIGEVFGYYGNFVLALTIGLACLTTSVGLITSCSEYFNEIFPKIHYRVYAIGFTLISFFISHVGLTQLLQVTVPVMQVFCPVAIFLVVLWLVHKHLLHPRLTFTVTTLLVLVISATDVLQGSHLVVWRWLDLLRMKLLLLPAAQLKLEWVIPAILAMFLIEGGARIHAWVFPMSSVRENVSNN